MTNDVGTALINLMAASKATPSDKYKTYLLELWQEAAGTMTQLRNNYLVGSLDGEAIIQAATLLIQLYGELDPKIDENSLKGWGELRKYTKSPALLLTAELNGEGILWQLSGMVRRGMENAQITQT